MPALGLGFRSAAGGGGDDGRRRRRTTVEAVLRRRASGSSIAAAAAGGGGGGRRRSFGSEIDSIFSSLSSSLAECQSSGPDPDNGSSNLHQTDTGTPYLSTDHTAKSPEPEDGIDEASQSFSNAVLECRSRSEANPRRRPASLDLNGPHSIDAAIQSPRFLMGGVRTAQKVSVSAATSRSRSGVYPSPGTPGYRSGVTMAYQKGWSSERVPLPANSSRRLPFNNGRPLPSKWDDAEKWICSPVDRVGRPSLPQPHHRRPKSKSGPLGPAAGNGSPYNATSPLMPCFDNGRIENFAAESPLMAGVLVPDRGCCGSYSSAGSGRGGGSIGSVGVEGGRRSCSGNADSYIVRSASVHGWSELIESSSSLPSSHDEKLDSCRESAIQISPVVLRKDMATQMSPDRSTESSPRGGPFSPSPSAQAIEELERHFPKTEVRDVEVDDQVTVTRWSKKHVARGSDKRSTNSLEWKKKTLEAKDSTWGVAETKKTISMHKREEAKIAAWENLQKAKAEAEIRKLEMKLEKKRSSSMDKILNKLRYAQRKAEEMRSAASTNQANEFSVTQDHEISKTPRKLSYFRRTAQMSSFGGCFTCPAF